MKKSYAEMEELEEDPRVMEAVQKELPIQKELIKKEYRKKGYVPGVNPITAEGRAWERARSIEERKKLEKRGPKFRNMMDSVKQLRARERLGQVEPSDMTRTVNAILEYQDGKEKGFSSDSKNQRFNDSMTMLAELTVGTAAEKYYQQQLNKVNFARGLTPESKGYLRPKDFLYSNLKENVVVDSKETEEQSRELYDKIKKLSFLQDDDEELAEEQEEKAEEEKEEKKEEKEPAAELYI